MCDQDQSMIERAGRVAHGDLNKAMFGHFMAGHKGLNACGVWSDSSDVSRPTELCFRRLLGGFVADIQGSFRITSATGGRLMVGTAWG